MKNKYNNGNNGDHNNNNGYDRNKIAEESRQEIVSILEEYTKDIGRNWEKISGHTELKKRFNIFVKDIIPKMLDISIDLENNWNFESLKEDPEKYKSVDSTFGIRPDAHLFSKTPIQKIKDIKNIHQLNHFLIGHIVTLVEQSGELIAYLALSEPGYEENNHLKQIVKTLSISLTKFLIKLTIQLKTITHNDVRVVDPSKILKNPLVEDLSTLQSIYVEGNAISTILTIRELKQDLFCIYNQLYLNQDNWKEIHDSI